MKKYLRKYWRKALAMVLVVATLIQMLPATVKADEYKPQTGLSDVFEYLTYDAGKAGTAYVNTYTGNLHVRRTDLALEGERTSLEIEFYYDVSNDMSNNPYGAGWSMSYNQFLIYNSDEERYEYKNENGTWLYFVNSDEITEDGEEIWIEDTWYGIGETGMELYLPESATETDYASVKLVNMEKTYSFDVLGRLIKISDDINQVVIEYISSSTNAIKSITDSVGRKCIFSYANGYLKKLRVTYQDVAICSDITYTISSTGLLMVVAYTTDDYVRYYYNSYGLYLMRNIDDCGYGFEYDSTLKTISMISQLAGIGTSEHEVGLEHRIVRGGYDGIYVSSEEQREAYAFENYGRVENYELQTLTAEGEYQISYGYTMTYDYVTCEDGSIIHTIVDGAYYDADGEEDSEESTADTTEEGTEESTTQEVSSEEEGVFDEETIEDSENYTTTTDEYGNVLTEGYTDGELQQVTEYTYAFSGNFLSTVTDVNGTTIKYSTTPLGLISAITDGNGNKTSYTYNALRELASIQTTVTGLKSSDTESEAPSLTDGDTKIRVEYEYTHGRLTQVNYGDSVYVFKYDKWGNLLSVEMDAILLVEYDYGEKTYKGLVQSVEYGNGESIYYTYNALGQVTTIGYAEDTVAYEYTYTSNGTLKQICDYVNLFVTQYTDTGYAVYRGTLDNMTELLYQYESTDENYQETILGQSLYYEQGENDDLEENKTVLWQTITNSLGAEIFRESTTSDGFERLVEKILTVGNLNITQNYDYITNGNLTGNRIDDYTVSYQQGNVTGNMAFSYGYDGNGNITVEEKTVPTSEGTVTYRTEYTYDKTGQLTEAYDVTNGIRYRYSYDAYGNILCKETYLVTENGEILSEQIIQEYDGMVLTGSYNTITGEHVQYVNEAGYLTSVQKRGETYRYSWGQGRRLTEIQDVSTGNKITYGYNESGLRISKIITENGTSTTTEYVWGEHGLAGFTTGDDTVVVLYGSDGAPVGFALNGVTYTYIKNLQGDVLRILDTDGNTVVEYTYDPWGVPTVTGDAELAEINPCSYRGYDYDEESGYYYLQSRYYNPQIGRFLNADDVAFLGASGMVLGYNLFTYCENNPMNMYDPNGYWTLALAGGSYWAIAGSVGTTNAWNPVGWVILGIVAVSVIVWAGVKIYNNYNDKQIKSSLTLIEYASTAATPPPPNKGGKGTQTSSKTLYNKYGKEGFRIDVENPGNRVGQIHLQKGGVKYYYNIVEKVFRVGSSNGPLASTSIQNLLQDPNVIKAIGKGLTILGY